MLRRATLVLAIAILAVSGCSSSEPATTAPSTTTSAQKANGRPTAPPAVATPVDLGSLRRTPCAALTSAQQKQIGFQAVEPGDHEGTTADTGFCVWQRKPESGKDDGYGYRLTLSISGDQLAKVYAEASDPDGHWTEFEPREIGDLPAVVGSVTTPENQCDVVVGAGNGQGIEINGTIVPDDPTLCDRFVQAAEWIVAAARR
jgi:uncharacterized protein DUF3558